MSDSSAAFEVQGKVRRPWRDFLDNLEPHRPQLHRYCCQLTGNVWDAEDLVQDALLRVFGLLGKTDADLENPKAYLVRTATHLWIDRARRRGREREILHREATAPSETQQLAPAPEQASDVRDAAGQLLQLAPREKAAVLLKDIFDLSLEETASILKTTVGSVKAALHRGRGRLEREDAMTSIERSASRDLVDRFVAAMAAKDLDALKAMCSEDLTIDMVGGAQMDSFEHSRMFFEHAHMVMPEFGFGENPHWQTAEYLGEHVAIGFRTLDGVEGLNEVHRLEIVDGRIARIRCYCFCPDTLATVAGDLGINPLKRPYRSPG